MDCLGIGHNISASDKLVWHSRPHPRCPCGTRACPERSRRALGCGFHL